MKLLIVVLTNNKDDFGEWSNFTYDPSLPGPSSGPVGTESFSSDSSSGTESDDSSDSSSNLSSASSDRPSKCAKQNMNPAKIWNNGAGFVPKAFKNFRQFKCRDTSTI